MFNLYGYLVNRPSMIMFLLLFPLAADGMITPLMPLKTTTSLTIVGMTRPISHTLLSDYCRNRP